MGLLRMADPSDAAVDEDVRGADDASPPLFSRHAGPVEGPAPAAVGVPEDVVAVAHRSAVQRQLLLIINFSVLYISLLVSGIDSSIHCRQYNVL